MSQCHLHVGPQQTILHMATNSSDGTSLAVAPPSEAHGTLPDSTLRSIPQQSGFTCCVSTASAASLQDEGLYGMVALAENDQGLAAGQYAVFYQNGVCLGSAQMLGTAAGLFSWAV